MESRGKRILIDGFQAKDVGLRGDFHGPQHNRPRVNGGGVRIHIRPEWLAVETRTDDGIVPGGDQTQSQDVSARLDRRRERNSIESPFFWEPNEQQPAPGQRRQGRDVDFLLGDRDTFAFRADLQVFAFQAPRSWKGLGQLPIQTDGFLLLPCTE